MAFTVIFDSRSFVLKLKCWLYDYTRAHADAQAHARANMPITVLRLRYPGDSQRSIIALFLYSFIPLSLCLFVPTCAADGFSCILCSAGYVSLSRDRCQPIAVRPSTPVVSDVQPTDRLVFRSVSVSYGPTIVVVPVTHHVPIAAECNQCNMESYS